MALSTDKLLIGSRPPRISRNGHTKFDVPADVTGFWLFNRPVGAPDSEAIEIGIRNRVQGAANGPTDNYFPYGNLPTVHDDYWTFNAQGPLLTSLMETVNMNVLALCRVPTASKGNLGATSVDRAQPIGSHGNSGQRGFGIEYNSTTAIRNTAYHQPGGVSTISNNQITIPSGSADQWRLLRLQLSSTVNDLDVLDTTGGGAALTDRQLGVQRIAIGGRIALTSVPVLSYTVPIDIAMIMVVNGAWTAPNATTMIAQARRQITLMPSITEGSV